MPQLSSEASDFSWLVGNFANKGRTWSCEPIAVNTYDFPSQADGVAIPARLQTSQIDSSGPISRPHL